LAQVLVAATGKIDCLAILDFDPKLSILAKRAHISFKDEQWKLPVSQSHQASHVHLARGPAP